MWREATAGARGTGRCVGADPVDKHLGHFTTLSSRFFIRAAGLNFRDGLTGDTGELGGVSTSIGIGGLASGEPSSPDWFG